MDWSLRPSVDQLLQASPSLHLQVRYQENQAFAYRAVLSVGQIKGDGSLSTTPSSGFDPSSFSGPIVEFGGIVDYNFRDYQSNKKSKIGHLTYMRVCRVCLQRLMLQQW